MRILSLFLGMGLIFMSSCGPDPDPVFRYSYTVVNNAGFDVTLSCQGCETVTIKDQEQKLVKTNTALADYTITHTSDKKIDIQETTTNQFTLTSYSFDVIYKVAGDAASVDVTLKNATGATEQFASVTPPAEYKFRDFTSKDLYISAKNKGTTGTVLVQIFYKDKLLVGDTNSLSRGTATAFETLP